MINVDEKVVEEFGIEWKKFSSLTLSEPELKKAWNQYFDIFPFDGLEKDSIGFDMGCGSGRWAKFVVNQVGHLNCIEPSVHALNVAKENLKDSKNISFYNASVGDKTLLPSSQDFGYCLGVLHHVPDTLAGINSCSKLLKQGAPFLIYLYYNFENKSQLIKVTWKISDLLRRIISKLPSKLKLILSELIAFFIYFPLARLSFILEKLNINTSNIPLSDYSNKKYYFMRTDSLDRFGTRLEKRFNKKEIIEMLEISGFENMKFSNNAPFWVCLAFKK